jgi:hypothetical protein
MVISKVEVLGSSVDVLIAFEALGCDAVVIGVSL